MFFKIFNFIIKKFKFSLSLLGFEILINPVSKFEIELLNLKEKAKRKQYDSHKKKELISKIKCSNSEKTKKEWEELICDWENCDPNVFKKFEQFYLKRQSYLKDIGLSDLKIDFINKAIFTGAFGMPYHFQVYSESKDLKLHDGKPLSLIEKEIFNYKKKWSITNLTLFGLIKNFLTVVSNKKSINKLRPLENQLTIPIDYVVPVKKKFLFVEIAKNVINTMKYEKDICKPFLVLGSSENRNAEALLKKIGIDLNNDWFVTIHVRESGWHEKNNDHFFRNGKIEDYYKSVNLIIQNGGKVVRVGNDKMTKCKKIDGLIDYAHSKERSEELDIILAAKSKFCIATSSGFFAITTLFDTPTILTNTTHTIVYYRLKKHDMFVPALLRGVNNKKYVKLDQLMLPPYSMVNLNVGKKYKDWNLEYIKNDEDDIFNATKEMMERLKENNFDTLSENQLKIRSKINSNLKLYTDEKMYAHGIFPDNFLKKHNKIY